MFAQIPAVYKFRLTFQSVTKIRNQILRIIVVFGLFLILESKAHLNYFRILNTFFVLAE